MQPEIAIRQLVQIQDRALLSFEDDRAAQPEHAFGHDTVGIATTAASRGRLSGGRDGRQHQQAGERRASKCRGHLLRAANSNPIDGRNQPRSGR